MLNVLGAEFKEVSPALHTRENAITFDEFHDTLSDFEAYLHKTHTPPLTFLMWPLPILLTKVSRVSLSLIVIIKLVLNYQVDLTFLATQKELFVNIVRNLVTQPRCASNCWKWCNFAYLSHR